MSQNLRRFFVPILLALSCSLPFEARADLTPDDQKEANSFDLTEKRLSQFSQATGNLIAVIQKNPEFARNIEAPKEASSISDLVRVFDSIPDAKKAVESAGMSSRDYWLFQFAMLYAGTGNLVLKAGGKVPPEFSSKNIEFYRMHEQEFLKLDTDLKILGKLMSSESSPSEEEGEGEGKE